MNRDAHMSCVDVRTVSFFLSLFISSADSGMCTCVKNNPVSLLVC
jgi:hypothetical protein